MIGNLLFRIQDKLADLRGVLMPALGRIWREDREAWRRLVLRCRDSGFTLRHVDRMCDWVWRQCPTMDASQVASLVEASMHPAASDWRAYLRVFVDRIKTERGDV